MNSNIAQNRKRFGYILLLVMCFGLLSMVSLSVHANSESNNSMQNLHETVINPDSKDAVPGTQVLSPLALIARNDQAVSEKEVLFTENHIVEVPEPITLILMSMGLLVVGFILNRNN